MSFEPETTMERFWTQMKTIANDMAKDSPSEHAVLAKETSSDSQDTIVAIVEPGSENAGTDSGSDS